jgi:hypothetical protein
VPGAAQRSQGRSKALYTRQIPFRLRSTGDAFGTVVASTTRIIRPCAARGVRAASMSPIRVNEGKGSSSFLKKRTKKLLVKNFWYLGLAPDWPF